MFLACWLLGEVGCLLEFVCCVKHFLSILSGGCLFAFLAFSVCIDISYFYEEELLDPCRTPAFGHELHWAGNQASTAFHQTYGTASGLATTTTPIIVSPII
jgi:hypothetical protein